LKTNQEPVDSLNSFNGTVFITVMCVSVVQTNTTVSFIEVVRLYTGSAHI